MLTDGIIINLMRPGYFSSLKNYYQRKFTTLYGLQKLKNYHNGEMHDFTPKRNRRLTSILEYAYKFCPYYKDIFDACEISPSNYIQNFSNIPLLDKGIIRKNQNDLISTELHELIFSTRNTGGSTGEPLEFVASSNTDPEHQEFLYEIMGYNKGDKILALAGTAVDPRSVQNKIYWTRLCDRQLPYGSIVLSSLYLTEETITYYVDYLNFFKPKIIRGYPAFVNDIAKYLIDNDIKLNFTLKGIELTSESPTSLQIETIASAFNTKVYLQYGHSEASLFGYTIDTSYEYYCSPFYGYLEVLNEFGTHVKPGELGEVVVTGFHNYAMPFIRYKTGDLAIFSGDKDGLVRLKSIIGRTQDYVYNIHFEKTLLTALIFGLHYKAFANIKKWQIIQNDPGEVVIKIIKDTLFNQNDEDEIKNQFKTIAQINVIFDYTGNLSLTESGKFLFLIQKIKAPGL